jgi:hypothetical protein
MSWRGLPGWLLLKPAEQRHVHLAMADSESGTPRQWWHLEIAARLPNEAPTLRARFLHTLIAWLSAGVLANCLRALGCAGLGTYRMHGTTSAARASLTGARWSLCVLGATVGLGTMNVTREFLLVLVMLLCATVVGLRAGIQQSKVRRALLAEQEAIALELTPSESALGFAAVLIAAGYPLNNATRATEALSAAPDSAPPELFASLGMLAPPRTVAIGSACNHAMALMAGAAAVVWPCWVTAASRQFYPALVCCLLVHYVAHGRMRRWLREGGKDVGFGLASLLLGKLLVHLLG